MNGVRSFFVNGFCSPWLKWKEIMREWLEAQGEPTREAVVMNTRFGISYEVKSVVEEQGFDSARLEEYDGEVPSEVLLLTAGVDVQGDRLEYGIYGWNATECWGICHGVINGTPNNIELWRGLDKVLNKPYGKLKIARTFIDSGYSTTTVYDYVRGRRDIYAIKGKAAYGMPLIQNMTSPKSSGILLVTLNVIGRTRFYIKRAKRHGITARRRSRNGKQFQFGKRIRFLFLCVRKAGRRGSKYPV